MNKKNVLLLVLITYSLQFYGQGFKGYYQQPSLGDGKIVFVAEGDIWTVNEEGGLAQRLTTHPGPESYPVVSPDGKTMAFTASYEGPAELYTMPLDGGLPTRWTYESTPSIATNWISNDELMYTTSHYSKLPSLQLTKMNLKSKSKSIVPLSQASEGVYEETQKTYYFVRPSFHRNVTKRYMGGTARKIWKFREGEKEAERISDDYKGESHHPMVWNDRIYFITDRDGIMNIWSMTSQGEDYKQHTFHDTFDVRYASLRNGKIVYQSGADIWMYSIRTSAYKLVDIRLQSDLDQRREKWVVNPQNYITSIDLHPEGDKIVITARGRVFVAPVKSGRMVQLSRLEGVRYRDAAFSFDGKDIIVLSDESGEFEFMKINTAGIGAHTPLTSDGEILRFGARPSPDGKRIAYTDLNRDLWVYEFSTKKQKLISTNREGAGQQSWSPDGKWLAYTQRAENSFNQIFLYNLETSKRVELTTDRANSVTPKWTKDGNWIYFLSDRNFQSLVNSPWGSRQPEPYFDKKYKIYHVSLSAKDRSPFRKADELHSSDKGATNNSTVVNESGIRERIQEVPISPGNYSGLELGENALYVLSSGTGLGSTTDLVVTKIGEEAKLTTMVEGVRSFQLSADRKKIRIRKGNEHYVINAGTSKANLTDAKIDLSDWGFKLNPLEDWKQLFTDAWRMERDYFYDPNMHGVDWKAMHDRYFPLVDRITTRAELSDLIGRFVGELSALHTSVRGGDLREGPDRIALASLGARFSRDVSKGGFVIEEIYKADPDYPDEKSPLDHPELNIAAGDVILQINGTDALSAMDIGELLRNQGGKQVRIKVHSNGKSADHIVVPLTNESNLRYRDWEYSRRLQVESVSADLGYVHLRAMGGRDISQWYREFYPAFDRKGLIIDVRNNRGGNIESFILEKLMRRAWFYWKGRNGVPSPNMQYSFNGHMVVLVDANTASDGEAFAEGFRRLGLGKVIGVRTWGGEIWLGSQNRLSDNGLARAPMTGVYGLESKWLIEGHGVDPDIVVDNLPHETFKGRDAQLEAAIEYLQEELKRDPKTVPPPPDYPNKSFTRDND